MTATTVSIPSQNQIDNAQNIPPLADMETVPFPDDNDDDLLIQFLKDNENLQPKNLDALVPIKNKQTEPTLTNTLVQNVTNNTSTSPNPTNRALPQMYFPNSSLVIVKYSIT